MFFRLNFLLIILLEFQAVYSTSVILDKNTFHKELKDGIAFVLFTNPTGDKSAQLNPVWKALRLRFFDSPRVKIAEIDCGGDTKQFCKSIMVIKLIFFSHSKVSRTLWDEEQRLNVFVRRIQKPDFCM